MDNFFSFFEQFSRRPVVDRANKKLYIRSKFKKNELDFFQEEVYSMKHYFCGFFKNKSLLMRKKWFVAKNNYLTKRTRTF